MPTPIIAQYYGRPMMHGQDWGWGFALMLFWGVVVMLAIVLIVRALRGSDMHATHHRADPLGIVKERYAKGEITREEFEQLKKDLA